MSVRLDALDGASRDRPLNNADPLSPLETTTLRDYVNRFVRGLYDKSVMQEAIGQSVLISDTLRSAFEIFQRAGSIQGVKTDIARQNARDAKITLMEAYIQRQSGCLASEELSRAYIPKLPAGLIDVWYRLTLLWPNYSPPCRTWAFEDHGPIPSQSIIAVIPSLYM
ncbi:hypothetical protein E4U36_001764 [Claviceps purpurea]|nr:hypothetical protein E4U36_001764 [Claviceps purpurea]